MVSSTFYGNDIGLVCAYGASPVLEQTIISFSRWEAFPAIHCDDPNSHPVLECCDIFGNAGGDWTGCIADQLGVNGNISEDPLFCDPEANDFTIAENSPCAPGNSPAGCDLIGALPVGCTATTAVPEIALRETTWGAVKASFR